LVKIYLDDLPISIQPGSPVTWKGICEPRISSKGMQMFLINQYHQIATNVEVGTLKS
jgi:hypothetical protein